MENNNKRNSTFNSRNKCKNNKKDRRDDFIEATRSPFKIKQINGRLLSMYLRYLGKFLKSICLNFFTSVRIWVRVNSVVSQ